MAEATHDAGGEPIWEVVETWLRDQRVIEPRAPNRSTLVGVQGNAGLGGGA